MEKKKIGRPAKFNSPEELDKRIEAYFAGGMNKRKVVIGKSDNRQVIELPMPTISGLVRFCGFCDRQSFYEYEKKPEFTYIIKKGRLRIEQEYEELLMNGLGVGAIFALKNFGWKDDHSPLVTIDNRKTFVYLDAKALEEEKNAGDNRIKAELQAEQV